MTKKQTYNTEVKELPLIEVNYDDSKAILTFLDEQEGDDAVVREVSYNKAVYENGKFIPNAEKAEKVEKEINEILGLTFDTLTEAVGRTLPVFIYEKFCSLKEVDIVEKFEDDDEGEIFKTTISDVIEDIVGIKIRYEWKGKTYESKMTHGKYIESMSKWFPDPAKKKKVYTKFEEKFGVPVEKKEELIGKEINVEVRKAYGKYLWGDIKKLKKK